MLTFLEGATAELKGLLSKINDSLV